MVPEGGGVVGGCWSVLAGGSRGEGVVVVGGVSSARMDEVVRRERVLGVGAGLGLRFGGVDGWWTEEL